MRERCLRRCRPGGTRTSLTWSQKSKYLALRLTIGDRESHFGTEIASKSTLESCSSTYYNKVIIFSRTPEDNSVRSNVPLRNRLCDWRRPKHVPRIAAGQCRRGDAIEASEGPSPPDRIPVSGVPEGHPGDALHRRRRAEDEEDLQGARRVRRGVLVRRGDVPPRRELGLRRRRLGEPADRGREGLPVRMRSLQPSLLRDESMQHRPHEPLQLEVPDLLRERERGGVRLRADLRADHLRVRSPARAATDSGRRDPVRGRRA